MNDKLLSIDQVMSEYVPVAPSTLYGWIAKGSFPRPCKVGKRSLWKLSDIQRYIEGMGA